MTCRQLRPYIIDLARGAIDAAAVESQVARHVRACDDCRTLLEGERIMSTALRRVADQIEAPPIDVERERELLERFEEARAQGPRLPRVALWLWSPMLTAAVLVAAVLVWRARPVTPARIQALTDHPISSTPRSANSTVTTPPSLSNAAPDGEPRWRPSSRVPRRHRSTPTDDISGASFETTSFVAWPGAAAGPPLEGGAVVRVALPVAILPALGLWPPPSAGSEVPAELLVGQDGFARAVRLVPE